MTAQKRVDEIAEHLLSGKMCIVAQVMQGGGQKAAELSMWCWPCGNSMLTPFHTPQCCRPNAPYCACYHGTKNIDLQGEQAVQDPNRILTVAVMSDCTTLNSFNKRRLSFTVPNLAARPTERQHTLTMLSAEWLPPLGLTAAGSELKQRNTACGRLCDL